jgi:type VI secretion system protein ImpC
MQLLRACAGVAAMAHAPFLVNASPAFFGVASFLELPRLKDLRAQLDGPQYARWSAFRDSEDARYVGLCLPRFLLRLPYEQDSVPSRSFQFEEDIDGRHDHHLWGHASIALAVRVADSFARYRWCPNIIGPTSGGAFEGLPLHTYEAMGAVQTKIPTEIQLTERREYELSEEGFIGLVYRKGTDNACFFSANSPQRPKTFGGSEGGRSAETNHRLGTQLPYMFIVSRLAHYIKVLERERIGSSARISSASSIAGSVSTWSRWTRPRPRCAHSARCARRKSPSKTCPGRRAGTAAACGCDRTSSTWVQTSRSRWSGS